MSRKLSFRESKPKTKYEKSRMWDMTFVFTLVILCVLLIAIGLALAIAFVFYKEGLMPTAGDGIVPGSGPMLISGAFILLVSLILGRIFAQFLTKPPLRPLRRFINAMEQLATGDFSVRLSESSPLLPYEFEELTNSFNKMAEELGNTEILRSDFVHNFSHEFKTPINSMRGFAKILQKGGLTREEEQEYLDIIVKESERLSSLATNVLNLTKIEKQTIPGELRDYDIAEQVRRTILLLESKWSKKNLELDLEIPDTLVYHGNEDMFGQIWMNLLDNAIKFSPENGKLHVSLKSLTNSSDLQSLDRIPKANGIVFAVGDEGIGMDPENCKHIFDKFYQGDTSHATEGNGIGLAIVRKIVSLYRGTIDVKSQPGEGSVFTVTLP